MRSGRLSQTVKEGQKRLLRWLFHEGEELFNGLINEFFPLLGTLSDVDLGKLLDVLRIFQPLSPLVKNGFDVFEFRKLCRDTRSPPVRLFRNRFQPLFVQSC